MNKIALFKDTLFAELVRLITGQLLNDEQIKNLSSHAVGQYLTEFLPEPEDERSAREKVETARNHISAASIIITDMKSELDSQTVQLDLLIEDIEQKKELAERYESLANTNKGQFEAFRSEMEETVKIQLLEQANKNKRLRQSISFSIWLITLIAGATLAQV